MSGYASWAQPLPQGIAVQELMHEEMIYGVLADLVVVLHLGFVIFAVLGGLLVFVQRAWAWVHLPCVAWAALVELAGWICPLTPVENWLRQQAGAQGYQIGFIEHYLIPILYPASLTRGDQMVLGLLVLGVNFAIYILAMRRTPTPPPKRPSQPCH